MLALAHRLLADAWVVERLEDVAEDFRGVASTRSGRVLFADWGELRQVPRAGPSACSHVATSATD